MKAKGRSGFGWKRWSTKGLYAIYHIATSEYPQGKCPNMIGYKHDNEKPLGKRSALNVHAAFDEAGAGNTIEGLVRQCSTLPARG